MKASICMATYDRPAEVLYNTLASIFRQSPPFDFEVIVVDDGSPGFTGAKVRARFPVKVHRIDREPGFRNPCVARNVAYRAARGEVIIAQSDEVIHHTPDAIERLVRMLMPGYFVIAQVFCLNPEGVVYGEYTGPGRKRPFFFLGSLFRHDLYCVGGNDEDFIVAPAYDDNWFADCLTEGLGLKPLYPTSIVGHHQWHPLRKDAQREAPSRALWRQKRREATKGSGKWCAASGPWPMIPEPSPTEAVRSRLRAPGEVISPA